MSFTSYEVDGDGNVLRQYFAYLIEQTDYYGTYIYSRNGHNELGRIYISDGEYVIKYKKHDLYVNQSTAKKVFIVDGKVARWNNLTVRFNMSKVAADVIFNELIKDAKSYVKQITNKELTIYRSLANSWTYYDSIPPRSLDTIYLNAEIKDDIVSDLEKFYSSEQVYKDFGMLYKRCYLFYGPPGTGKTSLIYALASKFADDLYVLTGDLTNPVLLTSAFKHLNKRDILLIEDIDSIPDTREDADADISALLNIFDGMLSKHGVVIFITANDREKLNKTLIRDGRIDYSLEFTNHTFEQLCMICKKMRPDSWEADAKQINKFILEQKVNVGLSVIQKFLFEHKNDSDLFSEKNKRHLDTLIASYKNYKNQFYL